MKKAKIIFLIILITILLFKSISTIYTTNVQVSEQFDSILKVELGKIEIPSVSIDNIVIEGTKKEVLDQNYVGHVKESSLDFNKTIILAGHNNKKVFKRLKELKKQDEIYLTIYQETRKYCVVSNLEIEDTNYTYFKDIKDTLILITCTKDELKRRIIVAKVCV